MTNLNDAYEKHKMRLHPSFRAQIFYGSKRADASHILTDDQRMNIVRAFVCFY